MLVKHYILIGDCDDKEISAMLPLGTAIIDSSKIVKPETTNAENQSEETQQPVVSETQTIGEGCC